MSMSLAGALAFGLAFGTSALVTRLLLPWLVQRAILDQPNERSSHATPTPRGGGLAVTGVAVAGLFIASLASGADLLMTGKILAAALLLAGISWADDVRGLPAWPRLLGQVVAVAVGMSCLPDGALVFQGLVPGWMDTLAAAFAWLWFVNLFNFMDGIDGITGVESLALGTGIFLIGTSLPGEARLAGAILAGAGAGFLLFNWHPAKVFLGDVGSVPVGFLFGWLLLWLAGAGHWAAALILPGYYLADATITLLSRIIRGEAPWKAHREHFYQKATATLSHASVTLRIAAANAILLCLAVLAAGGGVLAVVALIGSILTVGALIFVLNRAGRT